MLQETIQWRFVKIKVFHYLFCISLAYSYYRSFLSRKFLDEPSDSENRILMLGKTQINLVFRSLIRTIARFSRASYSCSEIKIKVFNYIFCISLAYS